MQEQSIFIEALEKEDAAERAAFLDQVCAGDLALRRRIERLLQRHQQADSFLETPAVAPAAGAGEAGRERPGTVLGPYRLLEQIGEGGMGLVFVAEQQQPVRRKVALKLIKPGLDTRHVVARFEAERQALALMDHPHIAKVLDGGETPGGRPYFVMELVKGVPITQFCDDNRLTFRQRLGLFVDVCQAVQHAHQKGIIHRDLKPGNVLVTSHDGTPVVKVIDFGVAKAVGQQLTDKTVYTQFTQMVGTPLYMSPEQAGLSGLDIDTRTDIYALGVLLYELLAGTTPFDGERLRQADYDELRRIIREEEPARPSTRFSTLGQAANTVSANRRSDPKRLSQVLRGELDWVVMKALEKDRNRRYETASAFAADVQRYLHDEPVQAGPPGAGYRLRKFVQRHRAPVLAAAAVLLALLAGVAGTTAGLVAVWRQQGLTEQARKDAETNAAKANAELDRAERQLLRAEWLLYTSRISQAQQAWESNNAVLANHYLELCRPDFRGWEHDYLFTLFNRSQQTLRGHTGKVRSVAVSPDGRRVASGSADQTVKVWDADTGAEVVTFRGHAGEVTGVAFSPDGRRVASGGHDGTVKVWDAATGQEIQTLRGHEAAVGGVAFSPDGKRLASASNDKTVRVWDADTGAEALSIKADTLGVYGVAFSPDGKRIVSTDMPVKVWDADTGREVLSFRAHSLTVTGVAFSPDGKRLASGSFDQTVKVWDAATGQEVLRLTGHAAPVSGVAFSPDGRRVASGGHDGTVKVWDAATGQEIQTLRGHEAAVGGVAFSPDGRRVVSGGWDNTVKVWDADAGEETRPSRWHKTKVTSVGFSPDGKRIVSGSMDGSVKAWDADARRQTLALPWHAGEVTGVAFSPDGKRLASCSTDRTVKVWDAATGQETLTFQGHTAAVSGVAFSPDGRRVVSAGHDATVRVWDAATGAEALTLKPLKAVTSVALSPDGRRVVSGTHDGTVNVWDADTGEGVLTLEGHAGAVTGLAFSPDGRRVVSGSHDGAVRVWDAATGEEVLRLTGHAAPVIGVAVMPDGKRIVSGSSDKTLKVWNAATGYETLTLKGHTHYVNVTSLAVSPDGKRIVSGSSFGSFGVLKVWDASMSQPKP